MRKLRRGALATGVLAAMLWPGPPAIAHGIGGRLDLAVPLSWFAVGGALVVILSFVLVSLLWTEPRLQGPTRHRPLPTAWLPFAVSAVRWSGVAALGLVLGAGVMAMVGDTDGGPAISAVVVWVLVWLVVPFVSAVVGDVYSVANPWRTLAERFGIGKHERPEMGRRWGVLGATVLFVVFAWMELVYPDSGGAVSLGIAAVAYSAFLFGAMTVVGRETALTSFDFFTVYNRLFASMAPVTRDASTDRLVWRGWARGLVRVPEWRGVWLFVSAMIGTVSYDGLSATSWWPELPIWGQTLALVASVGVIAAAYLAASGLAGRVAGYPAGGIRLAQRFAHTLVPIGMAYAFAHYFTLVIFEGQGLISAVSDPFALGWDLFGSAGRKIDFFIRRPEPIWYVQLTSIVLGHVAAVVLAHDRALVDLGERAVRSQYAMLILMVVLTGLGLTILAG